jgi:hypothetical protein
MAALGATPATAPVIATPLRKSRRSIVLLLQEPATDSLPPEIQAPVFAASIVSDSSGQGQRFFGKKNAPEKK